MSGQVMCTEAARWQLRAAIESSYRADARAADGLREGVVALARDRDELERRGTPLPEFPELPFREARVSGFRVFFRREKDTVWIAGVWPVNKQPTT